MINLTERASAALRSDEVVLVDWHVTGLCCADAGEFSVRPIRRSRLPKRMRPAGENRSVYVHPTAWAHLAELNVAIDCKTYWRWRRFTTNLPPDAGLRACMGRLDVGTDPKPDQADQLSDKGAG
jgi:hypothetical protein